MVLHSAVHKKGDTSVVIVQEDKVVVSVTHTFLLIWKVNQWFTQNNVMAIMKTIKINIVLTHVVYYLPVSLLSCQT